MKERGAVMVEFAFLVPLFAIIISGMMDCGVSLHQHPSLLEASRAGARAATRFVPTTLLPNLQVRAKAIAGANAYLTQAGLNPADYNVQVQPQSIPLVSGVAPAIRVVVSRKVSGVFTLGHIFFSSNCASSTFHLPLNILPPNLPGNVQC